MLRLYRATDLHEEKDRISRALGSFKDVEILKKVVDFALSVRNSTYINLTAHWFLLQLKIPHFLI